MAYNLILGDLIIAYKGRPRPGTPGQSSKCRYKDCHEPIEVGDLNLILLKKWNSKYSTKRFHNPLTHQCFLKWFEFMLGYIEVRREKSKKFKNPLAHRPRVIDYSTLSAEDLTLRRKMLNRSSYLYNRLYTKADKLTREQSDSIKAEIKDLAIAIEKIAPYRPFLTNKRKERATIAQGIRWKGAPVSTPTANPDEGAVSHAEWLKYLREVNNETVHQS